VEKPGKNGVDFEIDAALNDATDLTVFEIKASWLREDAVLDENYENFLNEVRRKYGVLIPANGAAQERAKGVAQLARIVGTIASREWLGENNEFFLAKRIYPVLLVHDEKMGAPGLGLFLHEEFMELLKPFATKTSVAPLTVIGIGDLENLESLVEEVSFKSVLDDYHSSPAVGGMPFHNFIALQSKYADKIKPNERLKEKSEELMALVKAGLFPESGRKEFTS
jgi:hypothetical protein